MSDTEQNATEIQRMRGMLRAIEKLASHASLTGSLEKGAPQSARQYNAALTRLHALGAVPDGFFDPLVDTASFDEIGVAAAVLAGYLAELSPAADQGAGTMSKGHHGSHNHVNIHVGGLEDLKHLGNAIREHLPVWVRGEWRPPDGEDAAAEASAGEDNGNHGLSDVESRLAEVGAKLQGVAEQLRRGDISDVQRIELAEQLSHLGQEQSRLAREHAMLRDRLEV